MARMSVLIQALLDPRCYPHPVAEVRLLETHISWLLLTGAYAYKIKKPVCLEFVDFQTLELRHHYCLEELRLNRRYAPQLYLDVVPITGSEAHPSVAGAGEAIEYAVKMREFSQDDLLDRRLSRGSLGPLQIDKLADACARFHATAAIAPARYGTAAALLAPALANFATIRSLSSDARSRERISELERWTCAEHARNTTVFRARKRAGRIRECHGDLHLGNIALIDGEPTLFDCIEFNESFRWIDVMNEMAFAVMDLTARGRPDYARRLRNRYLEAGGDYAGLAVAPFYLVYRALVRAKVDCIRASQPDIAAPARALQWEDFTERLGLAESFARPGRPFLAITCGLAGSGKTHASQSALERIDAIRIRSDVERKRLCGLEPCAPSGSAMDSGIYSQRMSDRTFARLAKLAKTVIAAGYPVIVDAAFIRRDRRAPFQRLAASLGVPFVIISCRADEEVLAERIAQRQAEGRDASEATLEVLREQQRRAQALDDTEREQAVVVDSADPRSIEMMVNRLAAIGRFD
ncbi:MAG: aminoglycoside phosphotransferase [Betaproteobacteria bacterium]|nr:MAG: aminoglycoside phosphotransferase [Betaproteobacteria bacterium]